MQQMEDKLQATTDQLDSANQRVDEQSQLIEQSGLAETRGASNGLPGLPRRRSRSVAGCAASYFYNLNDPNDPADDGSQTRATPRLGDTNARASTAASTRCTRITTASRWIRRGSRSSAPIDEENRARLPLRHGVRQDGRAANGGGPSNRRDGIRDDYGVLHQPGLRAVPRSDRRRRDVQGRQVRYADRLRGRADRLQLEHHARQRVHPARADRPHRRPGVVRVRRHAASTWRSAA